MSSRRETQTGDPSDWVTTYRADDIDSWKDAADFFYDDEFVDFFNCLRCMGRVDFDAERLLTGNKILTLYVYGAEFREVVGFLCGRCLTVDSRLILKSR